MGKLNPIIIGIAIILLSLSYCFSQEINELPMYGGKAKSQELMKADKLFVEDAIKRFGNREAASDRAIKRGFEYLAKNDWRTAMKRFNQAWLLTPDRAEVLWGFGAALSSQGKFREAVDYYSKANKLSPNNARLLTDFGFEYQFWATKGKVSEDEKTKYLNKSIEIFEQASRLDPTYDRIYFNWAVSLFFKEDYRGAWGKINEAERHGGKSIDQMFIEDLKKKMPRP